MDLSIHTAHNRPISGRVPCLPCCPGPNGPLVVGWEDGSHVIRDDASAVFAGDILECDAFLKGFLRQWPATVILSEWASLGPYTPAVAEDRPRWCVIDLQGGIVRKDTNPVDLFDIEWQRFL